MGEEIGFPSPATYNNAPVIAHAIPMVPGEQRGRPTRGRSRGGNMDSSGLTDFTRARAVATADRCW